jgi:transcriptional regulator with XRE-family HTH domain
MESTFGSRVREYRKFKGLSQTAFAEQCGLEQGNITQMEKGTEPKQSNVAKIIGGFPDLNPDWLLLGTGPMLRDGRILTPAADVPSESPRINSDRELVRVMTEEDIRISDPSGPPYRMRRATRTPEEEIEYLRAELLRERQAHERTRERHEADRNQNHERETLLIKRLGGKTDASADAADTEDEQPVMVAHVNHSYVEPAIEPARIVVTGFVV